MLSKMGVPLAETRRCRFGPKKERSEGESGECGRSYDDMVGLIRSTGTPTKCSGCRSRCLGIEIIAVIA